MKQNGVTSAIKDANCPRKALDVPKQVYTETSISVKFSCLSG